MFIFYTFTYLSLYIFLLTLIIFYTFYTSFGIFLAEFMRPNEENPLSSFSLSSLSLPWHQQCGPFYKLSILRHLPTIILTHSTRSIFRFLPYGLSTFPFLPSSLIFFHGPILLLRSIIIIMQLESLIRTKQMLISNIYN